MDARLTKTGHIHIAVSDITPQFETIARMILKQNVRLEAVRL
jgi:hypothetical protein